MKNIYDFFGWKNYGSKLSLIKTLEVILQFKSIKFDELVKCLYPILNTNYSELMKNIEFFEYINVIEVVDEKVELKDEFLNSQIDYEIYIFQKFQKLIDEYYILSEIVQYEWSERLQHNILIKKIPLKFSNYRDFLVEFGFLIYSVEKKDYSLLDVRFNDFFKNKKNLSALEDELKNKKIIGEIGEEFVLTYENKRLNNKKNIKKISEEDVNAGYDIKSFNSEQSFSYDRYIEVKTYTNHMRIYLSNNEINIAKKMQDFYYLYLVDLNLLDKGDYKPSIIKNPYKIIFGNENIKCKIENVSYDILDIMNLENREEFISEVSHPTKDEGFED